MVSFLKMASESDGFSGASKRSKEEAELRRRLAAAEERIRSLQSESFSKSGLAVVSGTALDTEVEDVFPSSDSSGLEGAKAELAEKGGQ